MAAGLGFKTFTTGEVLSAANVNGYLMQGVLVFASAAARDAAITSPQEGQFAYLKDTNVTTYYTGSAWANLDTTGMTNPMTTTGDTIYSSSGSTPARLGIGSTGQVLTVAAGVPAWTTATAGGLTLISSSSTNGVSSVDFTSIPQTYKHLLVVVSNIKSSTGTSSQLDFTMNNATTNYKKGLLRVRTTTVSGTTTPTEVTTEMTGQLDMPTSSQVPIYGKVDVYNYTDTTIGKAYQSSMFGYSDNFSAPTLTQTTGFYDSTTAITSLKVARNSGVAFANGGLIQLWGVA